MTAAHWITAITGFLMVL